MLVFLSSLFRFIRFAATSRQVASSVFKGLLYAACRKLTQEEIEQRLAEMQGNASWRERERAQTIKEYDRREARQLEVEQRHREQGGRGFIR